MFVVWSRQREVQRTFGTTVSTAVSHRTNVTSRGQISVQIFVTQVFCVFKTHDVTRCVVNRDSGNNMFPQRSRGWRGAISFRSFIETSPGLSIFRPSQQFQQVVLASGCMFVLVFRLLTKKDEIWMTETKAFLSLVPLNVGPSVVSRGLDSPLGAVSSHCCSATLEKQDVPLEELHKEGNVSRCDCKHHCSGESKPVRNGVDSFDTTFTALP